MGLGLGQGRDGHLRQSRDLDESLEVQHVRGSAEEVFEAAGGKGRWVIREASALLAAML